MMVRGGWYRESYRHYLAAKGISTRRYMAPDFKRAAESLQKFAADREDAPNSSEVMRDRHIDSKRHEYIERFKKLEASGDIDPRNSDFFMEREFDEMVQRYLKRMVDRGSFDRELEHRYKMFTKIHGKRLPLFDTSGDVHGI